MKRSEIEKLANELVEEKIAEKSQVTRKIKLNVGGEDMNKYEKVAKYFQAKVNGDFATEKALSGGADLAGKTLLPTEFVAEVIDRVKADPVALRSKVNVMPVNTLSGTIPVATNGAGMSWVGADAAFSEGGDMAFDQISFLVNTLQGYTAVNNNLLADTPINLFNVLAAQYAKTIVKSENAAILAGDGVGKPQGILAASIPSVALGANKLADMIIALPFEVDVTWRSNGSFIVPTAAMKALRKLKDESGRYIFVDGDITKGVPASLLGYPVVELASFGDNQTILFGDLEQYILFDRQEMGTEVNTQSDTAFKNNQTLIKYYERLDGKVAIPEAFVKLTGVI